MERRADGSTEAGWLEKLQAAVVLAIRYLIITRYSWLMGLVLFALAPVALAIAPGVTANLFVLERPEQIYHVSWIAMWCAIAAMETMRVTTFNAPFRFEDYRAAVDRCRLAWGSVAGPEQAWYRRRDGWVTLLLGIVAAVSVWYVLLDACVAQTARDPSTSWHEIFDGPPAEGQLERRAWWAAYRGLATTLGAFGLLTAVAVGFSVWARRRRQARGDAFPRLFTLLDRVLGPGYFRHERGEHEEEGEDQEPFVRRLAPGHLAMAVFAAAFLTWYAINYLSATGDHPMPTEASPYSALFYGLLSLLLMTYLLPGMAFFLDRYRVPVALLLVVFLALSFRWFETDHLYELNPAPARSRPAVVDRLDEVLRDWKLPRDREGQRTLVVVDASGGGIQASAWTAQVLTGLHERYGNRFSRSIGLISAVSGGSVGAMYYLAHRAEAQADFEPDSGSVLSAAAIRKIRTLARASALEAGAWGMAYPDTLRTILPRAVPAHIDRGWALERLWRQRMHDSLGEWAEDLRITDLSDRILRHQLPVAAFNATVAETGRRLIISPVLGPPTRGEPLSAAAVEFLEEFPASHLFLASAARLSATFPYVTPASRSDRDAKGLAEFHIVDGAYSDNEGAVTSVDWLDRLLFQFDQQPTQARPFDRVLLIRIQAFPRDIANNAQARPLAGWRAAVLGPLDAMMRVRRASQSERGDLEVGLLTQAAQAEQAVRQQRYANDLRAYRSLSSSLEEQQRSLQNLAQQAPQAQQQSPAELARMVLEAEDKRTSYLRLAADTEKRMKREQATSVDAVMIDFRSPAAIRIPLSWKLTARQQQNIDDAWREVLTGRHPLQPLKKLDRYFGQP